MTFPPLPHNKPANQFQQRNQRFKNDENLIDKSFHPFLHSMEREHTAAYSWAACHRSGSSWLDRRVPPVRALRSTPEHKKTDLTSRFFYCLQSLVLDHRNHIVFAGLTAQGFIEIVLRHRIAQVIQRQLHTAIVNSMTQPLDDIQRHIAPHGQ